MRNWIAAAVVVLVATGLASAAELAVLQNGYAIRHERHVVNGDTTRLYTSSTSSDYIDVPTSQVASYAPDDTPAASAEAKQPDVNDILKGAGDKHGLDPDFLFSVVHAESSFNSKAVSPKGARGLMQLMPDTAEKLGVKDSFDPESNVDGGARYLRALLDRYHGDAVKALAAYNAGALRVQQYNGVPPYAETRAYVHRIVAEYNRKKATEKLAIHKTSQLAAKKPGATPVAGSQ